MAAGVLVIPRGASRDRWLAARRDGITATDVVKIVGLSRFGNALDVYLDKRLGEQDYDPGEAAQWGQALEDVVARRWADQHERRIRRVGLMRSRIHPHHMASLDRTVVGERAPLEVKTRNVFADDFSDRVPDRVAVQVQWQMHVAGADVGYVAALIGGQEMVSHTVERDQVLIDYLRGEADRVWTAVQAGEPPEVPAWQQTTAALDRLFPDRSGAVDVDPDRARALLGEYRDAAAAEASSNKTKEAAKVALLELLGDHDEALIDGVSAYTYRATTRRKVDIDALLAALPEAGEFVTTTTSRRFHPARQKD